MCSYTNISFIYIHVNISKSYFTVQVPNVHHRHQFNWLSGFFAKWKCLSQYSCLSSVYIFFASSILSLVFYVFFCNASFMCLHTRINHRTHFHCSSMYINTIECLLTSWKQLFLTMEPVKTSRRVKLENNRIVSVKVRWRLLIANISVFCHNFS